jgi:EAL domain-containing protein (putative c-di-GMP-specific phosphodiesterase class I)
LPLHDLTAFDMPYPVLDKYLAILSSSPDKETSIWLDAHGRAQGRYFNCTLTSIFQPIRVLGKAQLIGFEAHARTYSENGTGLSIWKILNHAASDDESVDLDRLCRMLHVINFFRQSQLAQGDLYLPIHDRLLTAVSGNHGHAFRRILESLGLPRDRMVLLLPAVTEKQRWLLRTVADNYRRNGFRHAIHAANAAEALEWLVSIRPEVIKLDAHGIADEAATLTLLEQAKQSGIQIVFKRVDGFKVREDLRRLSEASGRDICVQGSFLDEPNSSLSFGATDSLSLPSERLSDVPLVRDIN